MTVVPPAISVIRPQSSPLEEKIRVARSAWAPKAHEGHNGFICVVSRHLEIENSCRETSSFCRPVRHRRGRLKERTELTVGQKIRIFLMAGATGRNSQLSLLCGFKPPNKRDETNNLSGSLAACGCLSFLAGLDILSPAIEKERPSLSRPSGPQLMANRISCCSKGLSCDSRETWTEGP